MTAIKMQDRIESRKVALNKMDFSETGNRIIVGDDSIRTTDRFWTSICSMYSKFGMSTKLFKMFSHAEVFNRLKDIASDTVTMSVEHDEHGNQTALAVVSPDKSIIKQDNLVDYLDGRDTKKVRYYNGIVTSTHPIQALKDVKINGDVFSPEFTMATPIDGFGNPCIYLSVMRQVCSNGLVAMSPAFKSQVSVGKNDDPLHRLSMVMESYNNEEGYDAITSRIDSAGRSWASISESNKAYKIVKDLYTEVEIGENGMKTIRDSDSILTAFQRLGDLVGDIRMTYGINTTSEMSPKKMTSLPTAATVYDLMNFITEITTHHSKNLYAVQRANAFVGDLLSNEYDLELSKDKYGNYRDLFLSV